MTLPKNISACVHLVIGTNQIERAKNLIFRYLVHHLINPWNGVRFWNCIGVGSFRIINNHAELFPFIVVYKDLSPPGGS